MKEKFAFTRGKLIGFICCALIPIFAMILGVLMLTKGVIFNFSFAITFFLIPLIATGLLALCIACVGKTWGKVALSAVILIVFTVSFIFSFTFTKFVQVKHYEGSKAELQYSVARNEHVLLPELSDVGDPSEIEYHDLYSIFAFFTIETDCLICRYTPDEYERQKALLEANYTFQEEMITANRSTCEPSVELDGYIFRLLSIEEYEGTINYPKYIVLIGYSDEASEIAYIAFWDDDLDYISSLNDFIVDECGWKYLR